jgi:hypothetical protein
MKEMKSEHHVAGVGQAKQDIAAGHPKYFYGARGTWANDMATTLRQNFGVELDITSCFVLDDLNSFRHGYNTEIEACIDSKYGEGSLRIALDGVQQRRKAAYDRWVAENRPNDQQ